MKRFVILCVILAVGLIYSQAFALEWMGTVNVKKLRIHKARSSSSPVLKVVLKNTKLVIEGQRRASSGRSWCAVRETMSGNTLGYVDCDGITHTMTSNWMNNFKASQTSASSVATPEPVSASANLSQPKAKRKTYTKSKATVKINGKDMTGRYKGASAIMYKTET